MAARLRAASRVFRGCGVAGNSVGGVSFTPPSTSSPPMAPHCVASLASFPTCSSATLRRSTHSAIEPSRSFFSIARVGSPTGPLAVRSIERSPAVRWSARGVSAKAGSGDEGLVQALTAEIDHEKETYQISEEVTSGPPKPWTVESNPGAAELVLRRSFQGEDIEIVVAEPAIDSGPDEEEEEEGEGREEGEEEEEDDLKPYLQLRVSVTKKAGDGTLQTLEFECGVSETDDEFLLERVVLESPGVSEDSVAYSGPDYLTLDHALQDQFAEYLSRRGLTKELGSFIRSCVEDKEQREYVSWLDRVKKFVQM